MSTEEIKILLYRLNDEIMNEGKLSVADEIFAPDYIHHLGEDNAQVAYGPAAIKQMGTELRTAFPDLRITVNFLIAEGELAASNWTCVGTYQGEPEEKLKPGQKATWSGSSWFRVRAGKICERWGYGSEPIPVE